VAASATGDAMDLDQAMIVAGIGCKKGASREEITAVIASALVKAGLGHRDLGMIATPTTKRDEHGILAAANALGVQLMLVPEAALLAAGALAETHSERVLRVTGVPSVAEAAAIAAAGPSARLLAARIVVGPATCALAVREQP
jgi:cobalt-precorrin 5A hydrolase